MTLKQTSQETARKPAVGEYTDEEGKQIIVTLQCRRGRWVITEADHTGYLVITPFTTISWEEAKTEFEKLVETINEV